MPEPFDNEKEKDTEFYSAHAHAWFATKLEKDKSLLTLSAGGVGLLVTLISSLSSITGVIFVLYLFAILCFVVCIFCILWIFELNGNLIVNTIQNQQSTKTADKLDLVAVIFFLLGAAVSISIGIISGASKITH